MMEQFFETVKRETLNKYNLYLKPKVTQSIKRIESTGYGKFIIDSSKSFLIWLVTCSVLIYTKLQIYYEKYKASQTSAPIQSVGGASKTTDTIQDNDQNHRQSDVKIYKIWNNYDNQSHNSSKGQNPDDFLGEVAKLNFTTDPDQNIKWYTLFSQDNVKAILIADIFDSGYIDKLKVKVGSKYLSVLKKDSDQEKEDIEVTGLIKMYTSIDGVDSLVVSELYDLDNNPLCQANQTLVLIDNEANTITLNQSDNLTL